MPNPKPTISTETQFKPGNAGGYGPPSLNDGGGKAKQVFASVTDDLATWLSSRAKAEHKSLSEYVRDVLLKHQAETEKQKP